MWVWDLWEYEEKLVRVAGKGRERRTEQGINDEAFNHYDIPLTIAHETEAMLESDFSLWRC